MNDLNARPAGTTPPVAPWSRPSTPPWTMPPSASPDEPVAGRRLGRAGGLCSVLKGSAPVNARAELPSPAMTRTTSRGLPRSLTNGLRWLAWLTFNAFALYLVVAL